MGLSIALGLLVIMVPVVLLVSYADEIGYYVSDLFTGERSFKKKPKKPKVDEWHDLREVLMKEYLGETNALKEYENSFSLAKVFKEKPKLNQFIRHTLFSRNGEVIPFVRRNNGLFFLKDEVKAKIEQDPTGVALKSVLNFVKLIAEFEAHYTVFTGDDTFYQNRYVDDRFKDAYNKFFMNTIDENMKRIVVDDIKANIMDKKYLGSGLMGKLYQENYVIERAKIKKEKNTLKNNYEALVELHNTNAISVEDFAKVFGDESIEIVEEAAKIRTGS